MTRTDKAILPTYGVYSELSVVRSGTVSPIPLPRRVHVQEFVSRTVRLEDPSMSKPAAGRGDYFEATRSGSQMRHITKDEVDRERSSLDTMPGWNRAMVDYRLAAMVIERFLGYGWWQRYAEEGAAEDFLRAQAEGRHERYEHYLRVLELARRLFELQHDPWFPRLVDGLRTRSLRGAAFEAEVLRLLLHMGLKISLVEPKGVKGLDYDIEVDLGGRPWAIEAKTREDDQAYAVGRLTSTLKGARAQLPVGGLGTIFVRVPITWRADGSFRRLHADEITDFLRTTTRVHAVVLVWDEWTDRAFSGRSWRRAHRVFLGPQADPTVAQVLEFLDLLWSGSFDMIGPEAPL